MQLVQLVWCQINSAFITMSYIPLMPVIVDLVHCFDQCHCSTFYINEI